MKLLKGFKKEEPTFIAILEMEEDGAPISSEDLPDEIRTVLGEFGDVIPKELPKGLPPRREVDHIIKLESLAKPPARSLYRMAPLELEELRKQMKDLLDPGFLQPSKFL